VLGSAAWWRTARPHRPQTAPWLAARGALVVPRAIHEAVWGVLLVNVLGTDPLAAVLAIAIPFGAITATMFAQMIDDVPPAALHALATSGVTPLRALAYGVVPQALPNMVAYAFYRFECALRSATVLGLIGAGGLGYEILLSLQSLRYNEVWTFVYALLLLNGVVDAWSGRLRHRLVRGGTAYEGRDVNPADQHVPVGWHVGIDRIVRGSVLGALLAIPWAWWYVGADTRTLGSPRAVRLLVSLARDAWPPRVDAVLWGQLWRAAGQTLAMALLAMLIAGVGGMLLSFAATRPGAFDDSEHAHLLRRTWSWLRFVAARGVLLLARALGEPIWALLALFVVFPGILPGALGLGLYNGGVLGRLMADVNDHLDQQPLRALRTSGATPTQVVLYGVLPATMPRHLAYIVYRWEVCVRATVVVGLVGAGGLGRMMAEQVASFDYRSVAATLVAYLVLALLADLASIAIRRVLR
jgi:phosphonate transport system permease protein